MPLYRRSRIVSVSDRSPLYTHFSITNSSGISKYRIFFFDTMEAAETADIRMGDTEAGLQPNLVYYPSRQIRTPTLVKHYVSPPEESSKDQARVLLDMSDVHATMTQDNMIFAINQEYTASKDTAGNTIGWLPPSPIQLILPPSFPVSEIQRPHLGITAIAPKNPDTSKVKFGVIPPIGSVDSSNVVTYYTLTEGKDSGILHYTVPTYSRSSFIHNHHPTENLLLSFHPKYPLFIVEPENIICLSGGMDTDVIAVSESAANTVVFTIGFGLSKT